MFNLKTLTNSLKKSSVKMIASNHFIDVMSKEISNSQNTNQENDNSPDLEYDYLLANGISFLKSFLDSLNNNNLFLAKDSFDNCVDSFLGALNIKKGRAEPYFYLAWLFNVADENETAIKYLKVARNLNPQLDGIKELSEQITESLTGNNTEKAVTEKPVSHPAPNTILRKPVINNIRTLKRG